MNIKMRSVVGGVVAAMVLFAGISRADEKADTSNLNLNLSSGTLGGYADSDLTWTFDNTHLTTSGHVGGAAVPDGGATGALLLIVTTGLTVARRLIRS